MTQTSWPFDNADTTEAQYSEIFKRLVTDGVWADSASTLLLPYGDSSGMSVKVRAGYAFVRGHFYYNDAVLTQSIDASTSQPRIDIVVLRLDPTANAITVAVVKGTPASSPVAPTLEQTNAGIYEIPLATVNVPASASTISAANVSDARIFASAPFGKWTTSTRPAAANSRRGDVGWNMTTNRMERFNGTNWVDVVPTEFTASQISDPQNLDVGRIGGRRITVATSAPSSPAVRDVWIDYS